MVSSTSAPARTSPSRISRASLRTSWATAGKSCSTRRGRMGRRASCSTWRSSPRSAGAPRRRCARGSRRPMRTSARARTAEAADSRERRMILSRAEIDRRVAAGSITISPYCTDQLNPTSYSYRLGLEISELSSVDPHGGRSDAVVEIPETGMLLQPGRLYLSHTYEVIGSRECVVTLMGRPSIGRLGLFVQLSADLGNVGDAHRWTLEFT